jgi:hypothetical protein
MGLVTKKCASGRVGTHRCGHSSGVSCLSGAVRSDGQSPAITPAYSTAVVQNEPDVSEARRQVQHAKEQLDLAGQSAARKAATFP